jgi:hypothetical protein
MEHTTIKVSRCEPYPLVDPQGYVVGFTIYANENGHSIYKDVFVSFVELLKSELDNKDTKEDKLILHIAYNKIKTAIQSWRESISKTQAYIGTIYTPPSAIDLSTLD